MAEMIDLKEMEERVILVAVSTSDHDDTEKSLDELEELAKTAGAVTVGRVIQNLDQVHPGTLHSYNYALSLFPVLLLL